MSQSLILIIDNYDSFTYNLVQRFGEIDPDVEVVVKRNDEVTPEEATDFKPSHVVISPGPCTPKEAGVSAAIIKAFHGRTPILGVCLGHQTIGDLNGMDIVRSATPVHGKTSRIYHDEAGIYQGLPNPFEATRYHSLIVDRKTVSDAFEISAWLDDDTVMGLRAKSPGPPLDGVQFHPESYLTDVGPTLLRAFLSQ
jgi:anthranilate synthase/aminodeoxychorismate synthase-like glutamine amidotransferase